MAVFVTVSLFTTASAQTNPFSKAQVNDRIRKVEDGVDEFRKYLDNRGLQPMSYLRDHALFVEEHRFPDGKS